MEATAIDSIDTAVTTYTYTLPFLQMTGDGLTAFNQVSGLAGAQLVPDLAASLPTPTTAAARTPSGSAPASVTRTESRCRRRTSAPPSNATSR